MPTVTVYTREEVAKHNQPGDAWIIIDNFVYDISKFAKLHPGGNQILMDYAGQDASEVFYELHRYEVLMKYKSKLVIGHVPEQDKKRDVGPDVDTVAGSMSLVPYGEHSYWQGFQSPYWNDSHKAFRTALRTFIDEKIRPDAPKFDEDEKESPELYKLVSDFGFHYFRLGPGKHLHGKVLPGGIKGEDFDYFHEMIAHEEIARIGSPGFVDGLGTGLVIGLPPVVLFGKPALKEKVIPECLNGTKKICLAITEPFAGSDVANIKCTGVKSPCGKFYIVNGVKKWITGGQTCDYFTVAVRTGGPGIFGISLMVIERGEGVQTKKIKTSYGGAAGTTYIIFENVKVPVENLLGEENGGFKCIMANFNHERWFIIAIVNFGSRKITEECFRWANQRQVFGKPLISQPVIRQKLAHMIARVEAVHNWFENITYQMKNMSYMEQTMKLAGPLALLKQFATRVAYEVSDNACQIFGGRSITRTGMGQYVERFQRSIKFGAILGGSEEIMGDLGIKMAMRTMPKTAKL